MEFLMKPIRRTTVVEVNDNELPTELPHYPAVAVSIEELPPWQ